MFDKVNMTITRPGARPTPVSVPRLGLLRARERPDPRLSFFGADFSRFFPATDVGPKFLRRRRLTSARSMLAPPSTELSGLPNACVRVCALL